MVSWTKPRSVNLRALLTRLLTTWRSRTGSPMIRRGAAGSTRRRGRGSFARALREQAGHGLGHSSTSTGTLFELQLAGLDLREVEDVVDDRQQALARLGDHLGEAALARRHVACRQQLGHHHDAVHRRADLVAHGGEEVGLGAVGGLGGVARLAQVAVRSATSCSRLRRCASSRASRSRMSPQHAVEAVDQFADLAVARVLDRARRSCAAGGTRAMAAHQPLQRPGDAALQAPGHQQADHQRDQPPSAVIASVASRRSDRPAVPPIRITRPTGRPPSMIGARHSTVRLENRSEDRLLAVERRTSPTSRAPLPRLGQRRPVGASAFGVEDIRHVADRPDGGQRRRLRRGPRPTCGGRGDEHLRGREQRVAAALRVLQRIAATSRCRRTRSCRCRRPPAPGRPACGCNDAGVPARLLPPAH